MLIGAVSVENQGYQRIKNRTTPWMDLLGIVLSEISQKEKDKCYMVSLTCQSKKQTKKLSNSWEQRRKVVVRGWRVWEIVRDW